LGDGHKNNKRSEGNKAHHFEKVKKPSCPPSLILFMRIFLSFFGRARRGLARKDKKGTFKPQNKIIHNKCNNTRERGEKARRAFGESSFSLANLFPVNRRKDWQ
jgi:hypothetical protein